MRTILAGEFVSAGIDYLTITTRPGALLEKARSLGFRLAESEIQTGMFGRPWSSSGYDGFRVGSLSYGERHDGCMMRLGSELAHAHWLEALSCGDNVTRIDLQVTFRLSCDVAAAIGRHYRELKRFTNQRAKGPAVSMLIGHDGSRTVYSGRRSSDRFGRIYDKGRESNLAQWSNCIRYEVEFKGDRARAVSSSLAGRPHRMNDIALTSLVFFRDRGTSCRPLINGIPCPATFVESPAPVKLNDTARSLAWLSNQVKPTVIALVNRGLLDSVRDSLSLRWPMQDGPTIEEPRLVH
jgi:hypothetical protein